MRLTLFTVAAPVTIVFIEIQSLVGHCKQILVVSLFSFPSGWFSLRQALQSLQQPTITLSPNDGGRPELSIRVEGLAQHTNPRQTPP